MITVNTDIAVYKKQEKTEKLNKKMDLLTKMTCGLFLKFKPANNTNIKLPIFLICK